MNMRAILLILTMTFATPCLSELVKPKSWNEKLHTQTEQIGTEKAPLFVSGEVSTKRSKEEAREEAEDRKIKTSNDETLVKYTGLLAFFTFCLFLFTALLWWVTYRLSKDGRSNSKTQSIEMQKSIAEATRAASAMEKLANHSAESVATLKDVTARQMRAYLIVSINTGIYQERVKSLKFEVKPSLNNSGHTPAHKMSYWATARILPFPLSEDFKFPIPEDAPINPMLLGPNQTIELNAIVDDYVPDEEVTGIKMGTERRVYIWGIVTYSDAFDVVRTTKFCHNLFWRGIGEKEIVSGSYAAHHNEAT